MAGLAAHYAFETTDSYSKDGVEMSAIIDQYEPIKRELERQKIGKFAPSAPVLLYGSENDDIVPIEQVRAIRDSWTGLGFDQLSYFEDPMPPVAQKLGVNHALPMLTNLQRATDYIWSYFPSQPAPQDLAL